MLRTHRSNMPSPNPAGAGEVAGRAPGKAVPSEQPQAESSANAIRWDEVSRIALSASVREDLVRLSDGPVTGEQYRLIRTRIGHHERQPQTVVISSPGVADGKTTTAVNLAWVLALRDRARTLLIDGDLRRPSIGRAFGIERRSGLADVLRGKSTLTDALVSCEENPQLYIMTAGINRRDVTELLDTAVYQDLMTAARKSFDFIIIDAPPVGAVADYELFERLADGVVMIVRPDHTDRALCSAALGMVPPELLLGVVMNFARDWPFWRAPHSYYDYSGEAG